MNWYLCSLWEKAQLIQRARLWTEAVASVISMDDMFNQFTSRFALTEEERLEVVVDARETLAVKTTRFLLIGKLLANKPYNKEALKRTMTNLWKPKARVTIVDIGHDRFSFAFPSQDERTKILSGGPWLFDGFLLALAEADGTTNPYLIPLTSQAFWVQVKGVPLTFMTRKMGSLIGSHLGTYIVTDQSRKEDRFGSYLRIRVSIDITKPLRRSLLLRLDGEPLEVAVRYEKIPVTCYLCGIIGHTENSCHTPMPTTTDDLYKPYGRWFQQDVFSPEYRKPVGRRFGLSPEHPRIFSAPTMEEETTGEANEGDALPLISHNGAAVITAKEIIPKPLPHADMGGNHNTIMDTSSLGTVMEFNEIHEENHYLPPLPLTPYCETPHREALPKSNFLFGWDLNLAAPVDDPHDHTNTISTPTPRPHPVSMDNRGPLTFWSPSPPAFTGPGQTLIP